MYMECSGLKVAHVETRLERIFVWNRGEKQANLCEFFSKKLSSVSIDPLFYVHTYSSLRKKYKFLQRG